MISTFPGRAGESFTQKGVAEELKLEHKFTPDPEPQGQNHPREFISSKVRNDQPF